MGAVVAAGAEDVADVVTMVDVADCDDVVDDVLVVADDDMIDDELVVDVADVAETLKSVDSVDAVDVVVVVIDVVNDELFMPDKELLTVFEGLLSELELVVVISELECLETEDVVELDLKVTLGCDDVDVLDPTECEDGSLTVLDSDVGLVLLVTEKWLLEDEVLDELLLLLLLLAVAIVRRDDVLVLDLTEELDLLTIVVAVFVEDDLSLEFVDEDLMTLV